MTSEFLPEQTIRYKTYAKRTLVEGINTVFGNHPDALLQATKATIEFPKTEVDYPAIVVRFFEREIFNSGVGNTELVSYTGESDSIEITTTLTAMGAVQLSWPSVANATGYKIYMGTAPDQENRSFTVVSNSFTDSGQPGTLEAVPTVVTALVDTPTPSLVVSPNGTLPPGTYYFRVTATTPSEVIKFQHYYYTADIEFAVYALSSYDRDLVADSLVQMIAMGELEAYTNTFFERIYPSNDLYPDSELHFININSDRIQGFGESQAQTPWGAEDDLMYQTSYRCGVFGELYSLPPELTYAMLSKIFLYPYIQGIDTPGAGIPPSDAPWVSNYN